MNTPDSHVSAPSWAGDLSPSARDLVNILDGEKSKSHEFTRLDLYNTKSITEDEIRILLIKLGHISKWRNALEKSVSKIQVLYNESISFLERVLYRQIPKWLKSKKWNSTEDFVQAISEHTSRNVNWAYSLMFCAILKVMIVEADIQESPQVAKLQTDMDDLVEHFSNMKWMVEEKTKKNKNSDELRARNFTLDDRYCIRLSYRPKSIDSIRLKEIYKRSYRSIEDIGDLLALRIEISDWNGEISGIGLSYCVEMVRNHMYGRNVEINMVAKGSIFSTEVQKELKTRNIHVTARPRHKNTALEYRDAKIEKHASLIKSRQGKVRKDLSPEVQIVLPDNQNERWFSNHAVYELKKVISANARLFWALTLWNLNFLLSNHPTDFSKQVLLEHLFYPQNNSKYPHLMVISTKSKTTGKNKLYITTSDIYFSMTHDLTDLHSGFPVPLNIDGEAGLVSSKITEKIHAMINRALTQHWK